MPASLKEGPSRPVRAAGEFGTESLRIPVEWTTTKFKCKVESAGQPALAGQEAPSDDEPVRLRVREAEGESCRLEIFFAGAGLCGASAG